MDPNNRLPCHLRDHSHRHFRGHASEMKDELPLIAEARERDQAARDALNGSRLSDRPLCCANARCGRVIEQPTRRGQPVKYCCGQCGIAARSRRKYHLHLKRERERARAYKLLKRERGPVRRCEWCSRSFRALDVSGQPPQRFCGRSCRNLHASNIALTNRRQLRERVKMLERWVRERDMRIEELEAAMQAAMRGSSARF